MIPCCDLYRHTCLQVSSLARNLKHMYPAAAAGFSRFTWISKTDYMSGCRGLGVIGCQKPAHMGEGKHAILSDWPWMSMSSSVADRKSACSVSQVIQRGADKDSTWQ